MQYVYVPVPEDRVAEIMRLLVGEQDSSGGPTGEWPVGDLDRLFRESGPLPKQFLLYLAEHANHEVDAHQIIADMQTEPRVFGGMASSLSRRCTGRYHRSWPISRRELGDSILYKMSSSVASVILQAASNPEEVTLD